MILYGFPRESLFHLKWEKKRTEDLVLMHNYSVVIQQFDKICFSCRGMQKAALSQLHCESLLASYDNLVSQMSYLTSRGREVNYKICETEEVAVIYCDKDWGGAITEECERNTEFSVKNTSKSEARDCAVNDLLSLPSGSQRAGC